jgi:pimeloyl-ACP methyl ester carboxylesterase
MSLPGRLLTVDGVRVFVHRSGTASTGAPPVVLVHGWMLSHYGWRKVIPRLAAAGLDVIAPDLPGFGESDRPDTSAYRYDAIGYCDTLLALLDALELPRVQLVGASLGGAVSLVTAARHPDRVERLALVDPLVYRTTLPPEARLMHLPFAGRFLFRTAMSRTTIAYLMRREIYNDPAVVTPEWVDYVWERVQRPGGVEAAHACLTFAHDPDQVTRSTRAVRAPTMIVWGEDDRLFPSAFARRLQEEITGSAVRIIPGCGHAPAEERPADLAGILAPFLAARVAAHRVAG